MIQLKARTRWDACNQVHRVYVSPPPEDGLGIIGWVARRRVIGTTGRQCDRWVTGPDIFTTWPGRYERKEDAVQAVVAEHNEQKGKS